jgi:hypothetical protein
MYTRTRRLPYSGRRGTQDCLYYDSRVWYLEGGSMLWRKPFMAKESETTPRTICNYAGGLCDW